jgi:aminobenzoyl-glutamate utilization protein B
MGLVAAKTIGLSMVELLTNPKELEKAWEEYRERTKERKLEPLLPKDLEPPIGYRWPQWIDNRYPEEPIKNLEWHIPDVPP